MQSGPDVAAQARFYQALTGGRWSDQAERDLAARYETLSPGTGELVRQARLFHARATAWASGEGVRAFIHCPAGYPGDPEPHRTASGRIIPGVHVFADPGGPATLVNQVHRARDVGVHAVQGGPGDARTLLGLPVVPRREPVCAHIRCMFRFLPPSECARITAAWGSLLPSGSFLAVSVPLVPPGSAAAMLEPVTGPAYSHARRDADGWIAAAGLVTARARVIPCGPGRGWDLYAAVARKA